MYSSHSRIYQGYFPHEESADTSDSAGSISESCPSPSEYSCGSKSQIQKFGNQSSGTRKSPFCAWPLIHFSKNIGQSLAASAVRSILYQYSQKNYDLVCTKKNLKSDFHITGQLMKNHPEYSPSLLCLLTFNITDYHCWHYRTKTPDNMLFSFLSSYMLVHGITCNMFYFYTSYKMSSKEIIGQSSFSDNFSSISSKNEIAVTITASTSSNKLFTDTISTSA